MNSQPELRTERLRLRPLADRDAADVCRLAGERAIADTTQNIPHPYPPEAAHAWIATLAPGWAAGRAATFGIELASDASLAGAVGLTLQRDQGWGELGYWIAVPCWRRGYATEASAAVLEFGFGALGLHRIQARHFVRNPASGRVMLKLGMRLEGLMREATRKWDRYEDIALYAVLASDWRARRGGTAAG